MTQRTGSVTRALGSLVGAAPHAVVFEPPQWSDTPACVGHDPELWFAIQSKTDDLAAAFALCRSCPIRVECLEQAMVEEDGLSKQYRFGIRGGMSSWDRAGLAKERREERR